VASVCLMLVLSCLAALAVGCERTAVATASAVVSPEPSPREIVLAPLGGNGPRDVRIRELQERIPTSRDPEADLERLGWMFITRAREGGPGGYNLALQCARAIESHDPRSHAALLLRGHALHSLHHFDAAERAARQLVAERGLAVDQGLLGDVLVDRGRLDEALTVYQRMMDIRPDAHSYARAAHLRYLKGNLAGALEAMTYAGRAASPRNAESFAWTWAKLASYQLQSGDPAAAEDSVQRALQVSPDSEPALRVLAQVQLYRAEPQAALATLQRAVARGPHPDLLWMLIDISQALGRPADAAGYEARLLASGPREDARATALYLATVKRDLPLAAALIEEELAERQDVYTYETLALVQSARAQHQDALANARRSLAAGTPDPRLYYHAGLVAERAGEPAQAGAWLARAEAGAALLLPSQQRHLRAVAPKLGPQKGNQ
jgi:tetratricopeptide (TPR) repeat protein